MDRKRLIYFSHFMKKIKYVNLVSLVIKKIGTLHIRNLLKQYNTLLITNYFLNTRLISSNVYIGTVYKNSGKLEFNLIKCKFDRS